MRSNRKRFQKAVNNRFLPTCKRCNAHDASAHDVSDSVSGLRAKGVPGKIWHKKWQGFDHIDGSKMEFLARIMVINNRFTVTIRVTYHNHKHTKHTF